MGLFGKLLGGKKDHAKTTKPTQAKEPLEVPHGRSSVRVYTYDGGPLGKMRDGAEVRLVLVDGRHRMVSVYTGTEMCEDGALAYDGRLVGFLGSGKNAALLCAACDRLGPLSLSATVVEWTRGGWPEIVVHFDRKWVEDSCEE